MFGQCIGNGQPFIYRQHRLFHSVKKRGSLGIRQGHYTINTPVHNINFHRCSPAISHIFAAKLRSIYDQSAAGKTPGYHLLTALVLARLISEHAPVTINSHGKHHKPASHEHQQVLYSFHLRFLLYPQN